MKTAHPKIVSRPAWLASRKKLLTAEKAMTRARDRLTAKRRRLPMTEVTEDYRFHGPKGEVGFVHLFAGQTQLVVYHFMFAPDWTKGCPMCTGLVNAIGDLSMMAERNTAFSLISHAPYPKLAAYRKAQGWTIPWYSSFGSLFNYHFHVTHDASVMPPEYNYRSAKAWAARGQPLRDGELPGTSVFFRIGRKVYHTYSSFGRGVEHLTDSYDILDLTPFGRQEEWEDSPKGFPQKPTYR